MAQTISLSKMEGRSAAPIAPHRRAAMKLGIIGGDDPLRATNNGETQTSFTLNKDIVAKAAKDTTSKIKLAEHARAKARVDSKLAEEKKEPAIGKQSADAHGVAEADFEKDFEVVQMDLQAVEKHDLVEEDADDEDWVYLDNIC
ncbi:hypothetical protein LTR08_008325 [Meristemomyces frigidus]|nr:hypothetical protein LTR08_008325 [Meristemomyces frigidus]